MPVKIPVTCSRTERPRGALLQPGIGFRQCVYRIAGRLRRYGVSCIGAAVGIPATHCWDSNLKRWETVLGGQFDWGGRLQKSNGGVQRFPQAGWKSAGECKRIRELDCETDGSSRYESRA